MPEGRPRSRLPRPGEMEALQNALDNLTSKINFEKDRMRQVSKRVVWVRALSSG